MSKFVEQVGDAATIEEMRVELLRLRHYDPLVRNCLHYKGDIRRSRIICRLMGLHCKEREMNFGDCSKCEPRSMQSCSFCYNRKIDGIDF